jgi:rhodanese-related sulfurtransferase
MFWIVVVLLFLSVVCSVWLLVHHRAHTRKRMRKDLYGSVTVPDILSDNIFGDTEVVFLDVRTPKEFAEGYIAHAQNVSFFGEGFLEDMEKRDKKKTYVVYCRSGGRSMQAVGLMKSLGFTAVYNLAGGFLAWKEAGGATVEKPKEQ